MALSEETVSLAPGGMEQAEGAWNRLSRSSYAAILLVFLIAAAGLALRVAAAQGDLWLDEIWSFTLLRSVTSVDQIFWRISHDNNHFANSVYLYLVGEDAPAVLQRALSIALGTAAIFAAAALAARRGRSAAIATALLFALSYPMVHYGSEARGYAGLVLFTLLAVAALERELEGRRTQWLLAGAIAFGFMFHLTMAATVAVLATWAGWTFWRHDRSLAAVNRQIGTLFTPAFIAMLPLAACLVAGATLYGLKVGGVAPFSLEDFAAGLGGLIRYLYGVPAEIWPWAAIAAAVGAVLAAARIFPDARSSLYVIGIVGLPALMLAARLPNLQHPRYFLVSGALLLLWSGEMIGRGIDAGGLRRAVAALALIAVAAGSAGSLDKFYERGRGSYSALVERMTRDGEATYMTNHDLRTGMTVDFFARKAGRKATLVPEDQWCSGRPGWLVLDGRPNAPDRLRPVPDCAMSFERVGVSARWGMSGISWAIYRRIE